MLFRLCREGIGGPLSVHPDYLGKYLNRRQLLEWAAFERIEPFESDRADTRSSLEIYWLRQTFLDGHAAKPEDYRMRWTDDAESPPTEAVQLMHEVAQLFSLKA